MKQRGSIALLFLIVVGLFLVRGVDAEAPAPTPLIVGEVYSTQGQPVEGAQVVFKENPTGDPLGEAITQEDGRFVIHVRDVPAQEGIIWVHRAHFLDRTISLQPREMEKLRAEGTLALPRVTLERERGAAFWIATLAFILMLALIATGRLHNTLAALTGTTLIFATSYLGGLVSPDLFIFDFDRAISYVDWNVIFLIMGMMIVIAILERTGIFQWLAFASYRLSGGRGWLLLPVLMIITGVTSAFLDNVTTMLLMAPISVEIALAMGINPLALLVPEVMASTVAGVSTLVGTPTNILIASYANITFDEFLLNLTPGVLLALIGLILYSEAVYWQDLKSTSTAVDVLVRKLEEHARITDMGTLKKAGIVGLAMLLLFIFGEPFHLLPAVTALMGATVLLLWVKPDIEEMIEAVDWTTLVFFMSLFIVIGAIQEVGLIDFLADVIGRLVGTHKVFAMLLIMWSGAFFSAVVDNIPFTAAMLPVVGSLTGHIPAAGDKSLFYCLSVGSAFGGNGSLIGSSPNLVTAGIAERAGYPITYVYFLKKGLPALIITVALAGLWLLIHFAL